VSDFPYGRTIRVEGGIKARSTRGEIGETWWSKRFLAILESFSLGTRLTRGRAYARAGQVLSLDVSAGRVTATVQGSRPTPYRVSISLPKFDARTWARIEEALAEQAIYSARLLAGEMPHDIEDVFAAAGVSLFPAAVGDLRMDCSCPDWSVPCKHLAATFYLLAEAFDDDPFAILRWRGRERERLLARLRELRTDPSPVEAEDLTVEPAAEPDAGSPLSADVDRFWLSPVPLPSRPPTLVTEPDLVLRQLATPPPALGGESTRTRLREMYLRFGEPPP
jgi:uncharacterized Zn finger protein